MVYNLPRWKNKSGTGERKCRCGSWKDHWCNFSGEDWPKICSVHGCTNKPTLGAHIYNSSDKSEYIVPMCDSCNKNSDDFFLRKDVKLVSANTSKTCNK